MPTLTRVKPKQILKIGKEVNSLLLPEAKYGVVTSTWRKPDIVEKLQGTLSQKLPPNTEIMVFPIRPGLEKRLNDIASKWPDPKSELIPNVEGLRAIAPQKVFDLVGMSMTSIPTPTVLIVNEGREPSPGDFVGLEYRVFDMEGIKLIETTSQLLQLDGNGFAMYDNSGLPIYADITRTLEPFAPPYPQSVTRSISHPVNYGQLETTIRAESVSGKDARKISLFHASGPQGVIGQPSPPSLYTPDVVALAREFGITNEAANKLYRGVDALNSGQWSVTWYGSIEVELDTNQCNNVRILCTVLGAAEALVALAVLAGKLILPWYGILILALLLAQTWEIQIMMQRCVDHHSRGRIGFSVPTGLFYAYEV